MSGPHSFSVVGETLSVTTTWPVALTTEKFWRAVPTVVVGAPPPSPSAAASLAAGAGAGVLVSAGFGAAAAALLAAGAAPLLQPANESAEASRSAVKEIVFIIHPPKKWFARDNGHVRRKARPHRRCNPFGRLHDPASPHSAGGCD